MSSFPCRRVGYWWSEKKSRKLNVPELTEVCRASGLELVKLDLDRTFEEQGPFVAIVHKLSDIIVKARNGDSKSKAVCESFQEYAESHPNMAVIDPLLNIEKVLDRYSQYKIVYDSEICDESDIFIPPFVELTSLNVPENLAKMKAGDVTFPIVCKPSMAHGSTRSHQMSIIFNESGLKDITLPCVVQTLINHNAVLYKLFIIGNEYFVIERPSLKNFSPGDQKTIFFDSNDVSKPHSASELTELDDNEHYIPVIRPKKEKMDNIVQVLHECVGLSLLGIDVIIDNKTGHYAIIDMNVFPGYSEANNFYQLLTNLVLHKIYLKENGLQEATFKPNLIEYLSTPVLKINKADEKFAFDPLNILRYCECLSPEAMLPYKSKCLCCPISSACSNALRSQNGLLGTRHPIRTVTTDPDVSVNSKTHHGLHLKLKQSGSSEYSEPETSDSCDEKKKDANHSSVKTHHHSVVYVSDCSSVDESG